MTVKFNRLDYMSCFIYGPNRNTNIEYKFKQCVDEVYELTLRYLDALPSVNMAALGCMFWLAEAIRP